MNSKLLHTPVGVRDIYGTEYEQKLLVMDRIHDIFKSYGYSDIQTPTFGFPFLPHELLAPPYVPDVIFLVYLFIFLYISFYFVF